MMEEHYFGYAIHPFNNGEKDRCTPAGQAREFYQALIGHGVDSELVVYPGEGHGVRTFPAVTDYLTRVVTWFERYMPA